MDLSIIIPVYNRLSILNQAINSIITQTKVEDLSLEIIIVDNESTEDVCSYVNEICDSPYTIKYVYAPKNGNNCSSVKNIGAASATGKYIFFMDCDIILLDTAIHEHMKSVASKENVVSIGYNFFPKAPISPWPLNNSFFTKNPGLYDNDARHNIFYNLNKLNHIQEYDWIFCYMGNVCMPLSLFRKMNGFDESFTKWGCEDTDFAYRLKLGGARFVFTAASQAMHYPHFRRRSSYRVDYEETRSFLFSKHPNIYIELLHARKRGQTESYLELRDYICTNSNKNALEKIPFHTDIVIGANEINDINSSLSASINPGDKPIYELYGFHLPIEESSLNTAVISTYWRFFERQDIELIIYEAFRIASQVFICAFTETPSNQNSLWDGTIFSLQTMLGEHGLLHKVYSNSCNTGIYRLILNE